MSPGVQIPSPALIWFQQEKNHYFLHDHVIVVKKKRFKPAIWLISA
jgi:hypothetical protein